MHLDCSSFIKGSNLKIVSRQIIQVDIFLSKYLFCCFGHFRVALGQQSNQYVVSRGHYSNPGENKWLRVETQRGWEVIGFRIQGMQNWCDWQMEWMWEISTRGVKFDSSVLCQRHGKIMSLTEMGKSSERIVLKNINTVTYDFPTRHSNGGVEQGVLWVLQVGGRNQGDIST
jgi:hypothetical protein